MCIKYKVYNIEYACNVLVVDEPNENGTLLEELLRSSDMVSTIYLECLFQHCRAYLSTFLYDLGPQMTTARTAIIWRVFLMKKVAGLVNPRSEASPFCLVIFTPRNDF